MNHLRIIICQVDDEKKNQMTELVNFDFPFAAVRQLAPEKPPQNLQKPAPALGQRLLQRLSQLAFFLYDGDDYEGDTREVWL